jgi:hypothetical protein
MILFLIFIVFGLLTGIAFLLKLYFTGAIVFGCGIIAILYYKKHPIAVKLNKFF